MKKTILSAIYTVSVLMFASCNQEASHDASADSTITEAAKPDMAQVRSEIVAVENQWAAAQNAKDINALMALYADDAVSMPDGAPTLSGKAAIQKSRKRILPNQLNMQALPLKLWMCMHREM